MSAQTITAAALRRHELRTRRSSRRAGPQLGERKSPFAYHVARKPQRHDLPVAWPGAARFSDDAAELNDVSVVRMAKRCPLLDELRRETDFTVSNGRDRMPGEAALAFLAFVLSGHVDIQPWWRGTAAELWWECGFGERPRYELIRERFLELEALGVELFFDAGAKLIRHAIKQSAGLVAFDLYVDCTEAESHVRLHHDCQDGEGCPGWKHVRRNRHGVKDTDAEAQILAPQASASDVKKLRQDINHGEFDPDADLSGEVDRAHHDLERGVYRVRLGNHWWRCRDDTAGVRAIGGQRGAVKCWTGFHAMKIVCRGFSTPIVHLFEAADVQEYHLFEEALERVIHITGEDHVRSMAFDAGFSIKDIYERCTERGVTGIGPYRRQKLTEEEIAAGITEHDKPYDHEQYDRDGVPRCKHCGGPTHFVRFARHPKPRVWFKCARPGSACRRTVTDKKTGKTRLDVREQSLLLGQTDPRYVIPLWRNTAAYQALKELGISMERAHHIARTRNRVAAKDNLTRPKRIGRDWQQLRANASIITDWLQLLFRQGWLPQTVLRGTDPYATETFDGLPPLPRARVNDPRDWEGLEVHPAEEVGGVPGEEIVYPAPRNLEEPYEVDGSEFVATMNAERRRERLQIPYGKIAVKAGMGEMRPPRSVRRHVDLDTGEIIALPLDQAPGELIPLDELTAKRRQRPRSRGPGPPGHPPPG